MTLKNKVFKLVKQIPKGKVTTYKEIANKLNTRAYQAIGQILAKNENGFLDNGDIPCHRVVPSNGSLGGFCGQKCGKKVCLKKQLLKKEGLKFDERNKIKQFETVLFKL